MQSLQVRVHATLALSAVALSLLSTTALAAGDIERGARAAGACMACHSFTAGRHMTGPSLAKVWGRKAGSAEGFGRYSKALKRSGVIWDREHLDAWLTDPAAAIPGNAMAFSGIPSPSVRADLLVYLKAVSDGTVVPPDQGLPDLKQANAAATVDAIGYCGDTYRVTTGDGKTHAFWEFNLRFKTDGSDAGPRPGKPVIVGNGMRADRASVVFSRPEEISSFMQRGCP